MGTIKAKIQIVRGLKNSLPILHMGELGYATDSNELFIGDPDDGNVLINTNPYDDTNIKNNITDIEEALVEVNSQLETIAKQIEDSIVISPSNNDSEILNSIYNSYKDTNKKLVIKSGIYNIDTIVNLFDNIEVESNVIFNINTELSGVALHYKGRPINFNNLNIVVNVENYTGIAFEFRGNDYISEEYMNDVWNSYNMICNLKVNNKKTIYPYTNASGTGIAFRLKENQIFMWTKFQNIFSSHFENGYKFISDCGTNNTSFASSNDFDVVSWRNKNSLVFEYNSKNPWGNNKFLVKVQPCQNTKKIIKFNNNTGDTSFNKGVSYSEFNFNIWDMHLISESIASECIDVFGNDNTYINLLGNGVESNINRFTNIISNDIYISHRFLSTNSRGNQYFTNQWDYQYIFGKGILVTDTFEEAIIKLLNNTKVFKFNSDVIIEFGFSPNNYSQELFNIVKPLTPYKIQRTDYGRGKIKIHINIVNKQYNCVYVEYTSSSTSLSIPFKAYRFYDLSTTNDSGWCIFGDFYGNLSDKESFKTNSKIVKGTKFYDFSNLFPSFWDGEGNWRRADGCIDTIKDSGTTANRPQPNDVYVGFNYFDMDLGKPIWLKTKSPTVWVDSSGTPI